MTGDGMPAPVFEFCGVSPVAPGDDLLGLWSPGEALPAGNQGALSFGTATETDNEPDWGPIWRANYPAEKVAIASHLGEAQNRVNASRLAIAEAPGRLETYLAQRPAGQFHSFSASGMGLKKPESELSFLLSELQPGGPQVSFSQRDELSQRWDTAVASLSAFANYVRQMVTTFAWVETKVDENLVGVTRVTWTGDMQTVQPHMASFQQKQLHQQTLDLALTSRRTVLRMSTLIISSTASLITALSTPVGMVRLIPIVLRFVDQLRKEFESPKKS